MSAFTYTVRHSNGEESHERPSLIFNECAETRQWTHRVDNAIGDFHRGLPEYAETPLINLPQLAKQVGFAHVFVKDESDRFGLPSFKILGASWAIQKAVCEKAGLSTSTPLSGLRHILKSKPLHLVTCSDGNWGRAVARMASYLEIEATILIPENVGRATRRLIDSEGKWNGAGRPIAKVVQGSYDDCIAAARSEAESTSGLLVMDTSWPGYEEIPQWVTDGYSTMLTEVDAQVQKATSGKSVDLAVVSVGVGSWAQAVVSHYKAKDTASKIVTVEPETAASFKESLHNQRITPIATGDSIMCGMNCGTTSEVAWPVLRDGVDAAAVVTDNESHESVQRLQAEGLNVGPCGAATLKGVERFASYMDADLRSRTVAVLFNTEGPRDYKIPRSFD